MCQLVKIIQTSCFIPVDSSVCQGNLSWHVQLPYPPTQILKESINAKVKIT